MESLKLFEVYAVHAREGARKRSRYVQKFITMAETKDSALEKVKASFNYGVHAIEEWVVIQNDIDVMTEESEYMSDDRINLLRLYSYPVEAVPG